ncbi:unnamed protein product [Lota lota]
MALHRLPALSIKRLRLQGVAGWPISTSGRQNFQEWCILGRHGSHRWNGSEKTRTWPLAVSSPGGWHRIQASRGEAPENKNLFLLFLLRRLRTSSSRLFSSSGLRAVLSKRRVERNGEEIFRGNWNSVGMEPRGGNGGSGDGAIGTQTEP